MVSASSVYHSSNRSRTRRECRSKIRAVLVIVDVVEVIEVGVVVEEIAQTEIYHGILHESYEKGEKKLNLTQELLT